MEKMSKMSRGREGTGHSQLKTTAHTQGKGRGILKKS